MIRASFGRVRSLWRDFRHRSRLDADIREEFQLHIELRTEDLIRDGLSPAEAKRRARAEFGNPERYKDEGRVSRGLAAFDGLRFSWLDFKLGLRMLGRFPGLTIVGCLAMALGIAMGTGGFEFVKDQLFPDPPYAQRDRIVVIENISTRTTRPERQALHDFERWREELRSVEHLSALSLRRRNLVVGSDGSAPVTEAGISASAFELVSVAPLLGRPLLSSDESLTAPAVAVLSHDLWRRRFAEDADVVGRAVSLGGMATIVVGVMPPGFAFLVESGSPIPDPQDLWVPFRPESSAYVYGDGPAISIFGRLASGIRIEQAQSEVAEVGTRAATEWPETHGHLRPALQPLTASLLSLEGLVRSGGLTLSAVFLIGLMLILCANVALLLFARAATREGEIAMRSALGASRGRIVGQLFAEALALAAVAIIVGLAGASLGLRWVYRVVESLGEAQGFTIPAWLDPSLSPITILFGVLLGTIGAVIAGVMPGVKVTGGQAYASLQRTGGSGSGVRLGGVWTGIIVTQVALTVMFVPIATLLAVTMWGIRAPDLGLPASEYVAVQLEMDGDVAGAFSGATPVADGGLLARFTSKYRELERRLLAEPGVTAVTTAAQLPGETHPSRRGIELDILNGQTPSGPRNRAQIASVDAGFFDAMSAPILAGRGFSAVDLVEESRTVVVNESFVREFLSGRAAAGARLRYSGSSGSMAADPSVEPPWLEIIGVVRDLGMDSNPDLPHNAGIYHPLVPGEVYPVRMAVRVLQDPDLFIPRLRALASEVGPDLRLYRPRPLDEIARGTLIAFDAWFRFVVFAGIFSIFLVNAGTYAVISFTVTRRTREIGIRVALGAERHQIIGAVLSRMFRHVALGVLIGAVLGLTLGFGLAEGAWRPTLRDGGLVIAYVLVMTAVCMLACLGPVRRAMRIEPREALAADG